MSNITEVTFTVERYAVTAPLYQYDYGQVLKITAPSLPDPYTVHFGNARSCGESLTVIGTASDGAAIPSSLLATGLNVYAWVFLHTGENDGETEYMIEIPVIRRAEPTDDPVIEEDPSAVDIIMGEIADLKEDISDLDDRVTELEEGGGGDGLTDAIKAALLTIADKCGYKDGNGDTYYQALYDAFYPPADLDHITAVYTQSGTVYDTASLDDLKPDLVVTAYFDDSTSRVLNASEYVLSGTLTEGTSTITVTYGDKTTAFTVTVSVYSTSPVIATEGVCWSKTAPNTVSKAGFGVTQWYEYEFTQEILESSAYWNATNEYMDTAGWSGAKFIAPDFLTYKAGYSWPSSANYKNVQGKDSVYNRQYSITRNTLSSLKFARQDKGTIANNCLSFSVPLLDKEYAYAYWKGEDGAIYPSGVSEGDIIFAGQNTPYYGLHNISEAPVLSSITADFEQGQTVVTTATTLTSLKNMLAITAVYGNGRTHDVNLALVALSGTLEEGTSTITATYEGKTATFDVTVSAAA